MWITCQQASWMAQGLDCGFDAENGSSRAGLELTQQAGTEAGVEFGASGGGLGGHGKRPAVEADEAGVVLEIGGDEGKPEVEDLIDFFSGFGDDLFKPGEQHITEAGGLAGFRVALVGEEGLEGEDLEAVALHLEIGNGGVGRLGRTDSGPRGPGGGSYFSGTAHGGDSHLRQVRFTGMTT